VEEAIPPTSLIGYICHQRLRQINAKPEKLQPRPLAARPNTIPEAFSPALDDWFAVSDFQRRMPKATVRELAKQLNVEVETAVGASIRLRAKLQKWQARGGRQNRSTHLPDNLNQAVVTWYQENGNTDRADSSQITQWARQYGP